jgi:hypothetical protein
LAVSDLPAFLQPYEEQLRSKFPSEWEEKTNSKGIGWTWHEPKKLDRNRVRIDMADSEGYPSQQVHHVRVTLNYQVIGQNGTILKTARVAEAHIPLDEYLLWRTWYAP